MAPNELLLPSTAGKEKGHWARACLGLHEEPPGFHLRASLRPPCGLDPGACRATRTVVVRSEVQATQLSFFLRSLGAFVWEGRPSASISFP